MAPTTKFGWLAFAAVLLAFSAAAFAAADGSDAEVIGGSCGTGVAWSLDTETGVMTITGANGSSVMDDYASADDPKIPWADRKGGITKVVFTGVFRNSYVGWTNDIGSWAFAGCENLAEVDLTAARGLDVIGEHAFDGCSSLRKVTMSDYVEYIKAGAFAGCPLEDVRVSGNSTLIYNWDGMSPYDVADMLGSEVIFDGSGGYIVVGSRDFVVSFAESPEGAGEHIRPVVIRRSGSTGTVLTADPEKSTITLTRVRTGEGNQTETRTIAVAPAEGYSFAGCEPAGRISSAAVVTVLFSGTSHAVSWMSQDGSETLEADTAAHGARPSYDSAEPSKEPTAELTFEFAGWASSPGQTGGVPVSELPDVTADAVYYAAFSEAPREYAVTVTAVDCGAVNVTEMSLPYGTAMSVSGDGTTLTAEGYAVFPVAVPEPDAQYTYAFSGWMLGGSPVGGDFAVESDMDLGYEITRVLREYEVTIVSSDGEAGSVSAGSITAPYGTVIVPSGNVLKIGDSESVAMATESTGEHSYAFEGWDLPSRTVAGPMTATAVFSGTLLSFVYEGVRYAVLDAATVSAVGFDGEPAAISVPDVVYGDGMPFAPVSIAGGAFAGCASAVSAEIGSTVASIGAGAFDCPYLGAIEVSEGNAAYSSLDGALFDKGQSTLLRFPAGKQRIVIPNVSEIAPGAFRDAGAALKGDYAGGDIAYFRYAKIPASVAFIGEEAFAGSTLECLKFQGGEVSIGSRAFAGCSALNYVVFGAEFGCVADGAFDGCAFIGEDGKEMDLADAIAGHKFTGTGSSDLRVYVPSSGTIVDGGMKYRITSGESKTVAAAGFAGAAADYLVIPESVRYLGFDWAVTEVAPKAFYGCKAVEYVSVEGAVSVGSYAFFGCTALEAADIGPVTALGTSAFSGCKALATISLENVVSVEKHAFFSCKALAFADLSSAETIGYGAFTGTNLEEVSFGDALADADPKAFFGYVFKNADGDKIKATPDNLKGLDFSGQGKVLAAEA